MAFVIAPDFPIKSVTWSLDTPSQSNTSAWTGTRTVVTNPWHGKWSAHVELATQQGEDEFRSYRSFLVRCQGSLGTFRLYATAGAQNSNFDVLAAASVAAAATTMTIYGETTPLLDGQFFTINGQLCCCTADQSGSTLTFEPPLRQAVTAGTVVVTSRPYALVYLSDSKFSWQVAPWRQYGLAFDVEEAILETDDTAPEGTAIVFPIDALAAAAAYGTRKLSSTYAGAAIRVLRTSDSTEQDIGFIGAQLDIPTLNTFLSGTTGRVSKWYDQSGNGRDATQTTSAARPYIDNQLMRGNQMLRFDGDQSLAVPSSVVLDGQGGTVIGVGGVLGWGFPTRGAWAQLGSSQFLFMTSTQYDIGGSWAGLHAASWINVVGFRLAATGQKNIQNEDTASTIAVQSAGALTGATIGDLPGAAGNGMIGQMSAVIFYASALSDADLSAARLAYSAAFDVATTTTKQVIALGDSIFAGQPLTRQHSAVRDAMASMPSGTRFHNMSVGGATTQSVTTLYPISYTAIIAAHPSVVVINLGTNNVSAGDSASTIFSGLGDLCDLVHADGGKVIICTLLPSNAYTSPKLAQLAALNTQIRADWATIADGMIDYAADPTMGAPTAPADTTLYIDGIHPTELGESYTVPATETALLALI